MSLLDPRDPGSELKTSDAALATETRALQTLEKHVMNVGNVFDFISPRVGKKILVAPDGREALLALIVLPGPQSPVLRHLWRSASFVVADACAMNDLFDTLSAECAGELEIYVPDVVKAISRACAPT
eukprot:tig00000734_g3765.t1